MAIKDDIKENFRNKVEESTGIIGQAMREKRRKLERQQEIQKEVAEIQQNTSRIKTAGSYLTKLEVSFLQISKNIQLMAKALNAQVTLQEETNKSLQSTTTTSPELNKQTSKQSQLVNTADDKENESLLDKIGNLVDMFEKKTKGKKPQGKKPRGKETPKEKVKRIKVEEKTKTKETKQRAKVEDKATAAKKAAEEEAKAAGKSAKEVSKAGKTAAKQVVKKASQAAVKAAARKALLKSIGKLAAKSIPYVGAAAGLGFAIQRLLAGDPVGAGIEAVGGLGSALTSIPATILNTTRDVYYEMYGVYPEQDDSPDKAERYAEVYKVVKEEVEAALKNAVFAKPEAPAGMEFDAEGNVIASPVQQAIKKASPPDQQAIKKTPPPAPPPNPVPTNFGSVVNPHAGQQQTQPIKQPAIPATPAKQEPARPTEEQIRNVAKKAIAGNGKFSNPKDFNNELFPYAQKVSEMIGGKVPPIAILGQWAGESGSGKSMPADYNYAGIKAGKQFAKGDFVLTEERYTDAQLEKAKASGEELAAVLGPDDKINKKGRQVTIDEWYGKGAWQGAKNEGKNWVQVKSFFAKFKDFNDFATSFAKFIMSPRYAKAREQTTPAGFGFEIAKAGYATASAEKYSAKIANFASSQGADINQMSASVADSKRTKSGSGDTVVVNNTTVQNGGGAQKAPQSQVTRTAGA